MLRSSSAPPVPCAAHPGFSRESYVEPARRAGRSTFEILAGEVHRSLRLSSQLPNVCSALRGRKFLEENHVILEKVEGPPAMGAIHLASAGQARVSLFLTNDRALHRHVIPGIDFIAGLDVNLF